MPDRDTGLKPGDHAEIVGNVVDIHPNGLDVYFEMPSGSKIWVRAMNLRPLPTPSATAQRVVEAVTAVVKRMREPHRNISSLDLGWGSLGKEVLAATDAHLASLKPADPLAVALELESAAECLMEARHDLVIVQNKFCTIFGDTDRRAGVEREHIQAQQRVEAATNRWKEARAAIPLIEAAIAKGEG